MFFEGVSKAGGMEVTYVFNKKVVNDEAEEDWELFVAPKTRNGDVLVVSVLF